MNALRERLSRNSPILTLVRKLPKWAVLAVVAAVFLPLAVDWVPPGEGARLSCLVLRASCEGDGGFIETALPGMFPLWSWLVGLAGRGVPEAQLFLGKGTAPAK